ncbi:hypothetical protein AACVs1_gp2 [Anopheline-associated C virus]|uniref:hypothetical protein n=1 Tax=Anopheline-associated C virus TaxID=1398939 RepID=UPI0003B06D47|nr:hypothetical protein AACVs1_gp2 [Anopheline-associated C virus]AGW51772.1 hypothetical protein [Anopheline-associated C virus]
MDIKKIIEHLDPKNETFYSIEQAFDPSPIWVRATRWFRVRFSPEPNLLVRGIKTAANSLVGGIPRVRNGAVNGAGHAKTVARAAWDTAKYHSTVLVISAVGTCAAIYAATWIWRSRRVLFVQVINDGTMLPIPTLKDHFATRLSKRPEDYGPTLPGLHLRIAAERRRAEQAVFEVFDDIKLRFRDVGGSLSRGKDYVQLKHVCNPVLDSADILRRAKADECPFDTCKGVGQKCPQRAAFPGALLCHSDYYMDQEDLVACVRSHTFVINHRYTADSKVNHLGEMEVAVEGPYVKGGTSDGTRYSHAYNLWQAEGSVVGKEGAFVYTRVWTGPSMDIYYAYPAPGTYRKDDPQALKRSTDINMVKLTTGHFAHITDHQVSVRTTDGTLVMAFPRTELEKTVLKCGGAIRDSKYISTVTSYVTAKLTAGDHNIASAADLTEIALAACETYALDIYSRHTRNYDPADLGTFKRLWLGFQDSTHRGRLWVTSAYTHDYVFRHPLSALTPWLFRRVEMPGYVRHFTNTRVNLKSLNPDPRPFRDGVGPHHAKPDNAQHDGTDSVRGKPSDQRGHQSAKTLPAAVPILDKDAEADALGSDAWVDASAEPEQSDEDVQKDGLENSGGDGGIAVGGGGGHSPDLGTTLENIRPTVTGTVREPNIVLAINGQGHVRAVYLPALDDPVNIDPDDVRHVTKQDIQDASDRLWNAAANGREAAITVLQNIIRYKRESQGHSSKASGARILPNLRNGMVERRARTVTIQSVDKTVSSVEEGHSRKGTQRGDGHGRRAETTWTGRQLPQKGGYERVWRPSQHKSQNRRIPMRHGTSRGRYRESSPPSSISD